MAWLRWLYGALSPSGRRAGLSILIFHRVRPQADPIWSGGPDARRFDELLGWIGAGFRVMPLDDAILALDAGRLPARALSITFDDGYADNHAIAWPILQRHRMNATFFIASDFLDGGRMWNDTIVEAVRRAPGTELDLSAMGLGTHRIGDAAQRRHAIGSLLQQTKYMPMQERQQIVEQLERSIGAALPDDLMMRSDQLRQLHAGGMRIGGHTRGHPILARIGDDEAREEIAGGKARLESLIGQSLTLFAYPNGKPGQDYLAAHARMAREAGYRAAVSTSPGMARQGADLFQLPRFTPWDRTPWRFGLRMARNMRSPGQLAPA
jgi:peptidoglycan/xylan/chitin deacetylase (PgdA/CDA1 family)